jgi:hypothetical protein
MSEDFSQIEQIIQEIDRLISEMSHLRSRVAALGSPLASAPGSVRPAEYFGMWAGREDMQGLSSRAWLEQLRTQQ